MAKIVTIVWILTLIVIGVSGCFRSDNTIPEAELPRDTLPIVTGTVLPPNAEDPTLTSEDEKIVEAIINEVIEVPEESEPSTGQ